MASVTPLAFTMLWFSSFLCVPILLNVPTAIMFEFHYKYIPNAIKSTKSLPRDNDLKIGCGRFLTFHFKLTDALCAGSWRRGTYTLIQIKPSWSPIIMGVFFFQSSIPQHLSALTSVNALDSHIAASTGVRGFFKGAVMTWEWKPPGDVWIIVNKLVSGSLDAWRACV